MDIDLGQDIEFNIKYKGATYKMREPSVKEAASLGDSENSMEVIQFLSKLGLPEQVLSDMPLSKMKKLVESMLGSIQEKK